APRTRRGLAFLDASDRPRARGGMTSPRTVDEPHRNAALGLEPIRTISRDELRAKLDRGDDFKLIMALNRWAFDAKHIPGSVHFDTPRSCTPPFDRRTRSSSTVPTWTASRASRCIGTLSDAATGACAVTRAGCSTGRMRAFRSKASSWPSDEQPALFAHELGAGPPVRRRDRGRAAR